MVGLNKNMKHVEINGSGRRFIRSVLVDTGNANTKYVGMFVAYTHQPTNINSGKEPPPPPTASVHCNKEI